MLTEDEIYKKVQFAVEHQYINVDLLSDREIFDFEDDLATYQVQVSLVLPALSARERRKIKRGWGNKDIYRKLAQYIEPRQEYPKECPRCGRMMGCKQDASTSWRVIPNCMYCDEGLTNRKDVL